LKKHRANIITAGRIVGTLVILLMLPLETVAGQQLAVLLFLGLMLSDAADGLVARSRWGQITRLGQNLDPLADKLLVLVYVPLVEMGQVGSLPVVVILLRDLAVTALRQLVAHEGQTIPAQWSGKLKTIIAFPLAGILLCRVDNLVGDPIGWLPGIGFLISQLIRFAQSIPNLIMTATVGVLVVVTLISLLDYFAHPLLRQNLSSSGR
jgi:CDP-diacylglycerol---glycerol-3-phosphate 3-phosphatidyltransferase